MIRGARRGPLAEGYEPITVETDRGGIDLRLYEVPEARVAAVFVGDAGGGWDSPGRGRLFPDLCKDFQDMGVASLRVRYRRPNDLIECSLDLLTGLHFVAREGVEIAALVGHSFGGAVAAQVAANAEGVRTVALLSTQSHGIEAIAQISQGCSALFVHGTADEVLPVSCSEYAYDLAPEPKRLSLYEGAHHGLDEVGMRLRREVRDWVAGELGVRPQPYG
ncbi:MAG TPA: alpha/beta hydrolase [Thermoanaerobaculia bacterium]|nr:alpha/beta hydrolase [Thermoanaerobaculia bacterium]